ncbi:MAG: aminomethyl-transferring glycine dehydrogenase subunit GcvPA [Pseudomonadota bacterium]
MPFIPHTESDIDAMLNNIGVDSIETLFDEIPAALRCDSLEDIPPGLSEMEINRVMQARAAQDSGAVCFIGAGAYEHHIPAAVWEITTRGEFYSAYTPYQAEASQGTLQLLYEFQSMMAQLTALETSNASLYDGATALAEAVLMAVRVNRKSKSKKVLVPRTMHPHYREVTHTLVHNQDIEMIDIPWNNTTGTLNTDVLSNYEDEDIAALVIAQPNFFGGLESEVDALTNWAHAHNIVVIAVVNPLSLALLKPPGEWGDNGVDIACGEGQPFGIPLSSGGPYFGFMCCKKSHVRQMPGRIIGRTVDLEGKPGYTLTLQAREQHIRRSKATSNICTNQGLMVTAATIHLSLLGAAGLENVASHCHANTRTLANKLAEIDGITPIFDNAFFHEVALRVNKPVQDLLAMLEANGILGGYALGNAYSEFEDGLLVCATEMRTDEEIDRYVALVRAWMQTGA